MTGECPMCGSVSELQMSHIVPAFVWRWLKETSGTGYMRRINAPNRRIQDGFKARMLCLRCEQLLSPWEKQFADSVFRPLQSDNLPVFRYSSWLARFCSSLSWRVVRQLRNEDQLADLPSHLLLASERALDIWASVTVGQIPSPGEFEQHIIPLDSLSFMDQPDVPTNLNRYILRTVDCDVAYADDDAFVYTKMCNLAIIGFIRVSKPNLWRGTKIHAAGGAFGVGPYVIPTDVGHYILDRARTVQMAQMSKSPRQRQVIMQAAKSDPERMDRSESIRALDYDVIMFGEKAYDRQNGDP